MERRKRSIREQVVLGLEPDLDGFLHDAQAVCDFVGMLWKEVKERRAKERTEHAEAEEHLYAVFALSKLIDVLGDNDNLDTFSYEILTHLVKNKRLISAGLFLLQDADTDGEGAPHFELKASIAYGKPQMERKTIGWGEGLVGRCAQERQIISMTKLPQGYFSISSGLGEGQPAALSLVPLCAKDRVYGVIEVASTEAISEMDGYWKTAAKLIATKISELQANMATARLLEETRAQAAKVSEQEDSLRQNVEELRAVQEESERRDAEMRGFVEAIDHASISVEFAPDGTIWKVNDNFLQTFGYEADEVVGKSMSILFIKEEQEKLAELLSAVCEGETFRGNVRRCARDGHEVRLLSTYTPVFDYAGGVEKVISIEIDMTEQINARD